MSRLFALTVLGLAVAALCPASPATPRGADAPRSPALPLAPVAARVAVPETDADKLLSPTSQLYLRWDGVAAHNDAYKKSVWGPVMAGPTGDSIRALLAKAPRLLGGSLLAEPLLDGKPPAQLKANLADIKNVSKVFDLLADKGVIVSAEVREPAPTLKGLGSALGGLLGGKMPGPEALMPDAQLVVIVPDSAGQADVLFSTVRLLFQAVEVPVEQLPADMNRKGFQMVLPQDGRGPPIPLHAAWWVEGKHFVFYGGTMKPAKVMSEMAANAKKGGVTGHPLYQRVHKDPGFESVARGFVDAGKVVGVAKNIAGPFVPGLGQRLDDLGFGNLKAIVFNSGFDGKESRATWEFDLPGERKGLAKVLKQQPLGLKDLPPMPPDVSRFSALRVDPTATYDAGIMVVEALTLFEQPFGVEENAKNPAEAIKARREYLEREFEKILGVSVRDDIIPCLGDKVVMFQSPTEGLSVLGTVVCVSLKDPAKAKAVADRMHRGLETLFSAPIKVRKKTLKGVEIHELYSRGFGIVTPAYAFVDDWLVVSVYPQAVQGFVLRAKGDLERWKPDADTAARLAKLPADGCGIQFCRPQSTAQNLCVVGPLLIGQLALFNRFNNQTESDYDPIDVGLIPNGHELSKHLFPNLTVTRDDGKTVRIEVNESFSLPLEFIGLEPVVLFAVIAGLGF
jgi:hypothetical protein